MRPVEKGTRSPRKRKTEQMVDERKFRRGAMNPRAGGDSVGTSRAMRIDWGEKDQ